jgi:hypothetical protein
MRKQLWIACLLGLFGATAFAADPPSIEKLVEQLGSRSFVERERATKALRERGPAALPALRNALKSADEEVRKRAESLIPPLEIEEALLPKRVSLKADKQSAASLLPELAKQTGFKFGPTPSSDDRTLTLDLKDVPFWEAVEQIGRQPGMISTTYGSRERTLHLKPIKNKSPYLAVRGPFRLEATWIHEDRDVDLAGTESTKENEASKKLTLSVSVHAEPRITIQKITPAKVEEAIDSEGKSLLEPTPPAPKVKEPQPPPPGLVGRPRPAPQPPALPLTPPGYPSGRGTFRGESLTYADVRLLRASDSAKTLKLVRGTITVKSILIRKDVVVTSKLMEAGGTMFKAGNDGLQISRVQNQGGNYVEVEVAVPRDDTGRSYNEWSQRFHVEDDAGNRFQSSGGGTRSDGRGYWISMYFSPPFNKQNVGPATKLVFEDWIVHEHSIPFEFKDIPMP